MMRRLGPFLFLCGWLAVAATCAAADALSDSDLKEAVIYNMLSFVSWPAESTQGLDAFRLCVIDDATHPLTLAGIAGRRLSNQRRIAVIRIGRDLAGLRKCHAVFVAGADYRRLAAVAAGSEHAPVLILGEGDQAIQHGATVGIALTAGRVVFDVNLAAARSARLTVSSKVLRLARRVYE